MNLSCALDFNEWPVESRTLLALRISAEGSPIFLRGFALVATELVESDYYNFWTIEIGTFNFNYVPVFRKPFKSGISDHCVTYDGVDAVFQAGDVVAVRLVPTGQPHQIKGLQVALDGYEIRSRYAR